MFCEWNKSFLMYFKQDEGEFLFDLYNVSFCKFPPPSYISLPFRLLMRGRSLEFINIRGTEKLCQQLQSVIYGVR